MVFIESGHNIDPRITPIIKRVAGPVGSFFLPPIRLIDATYARNRSGGSLRNTLQFTPNSLDSFLFVENDIGTQVAVADQPQWRDTAPVATGSEDFEVGCLEILDSSGAPFNVWAIQPAAIGAFDAISGTTKWFLPNGIGFTVGRFMVRRIIGSVELARADIRLERLT